VCCFRVSDVFVCSACGHAAFTASCSVCSRTSDNTYVTSGFRILHYVNIHQTQTERSTAAKHAVVSNNISEAGFIQGNSNSNFIRKLLLHISRFCPPQSCTLLVAQLVEALRNELEGRGFDSPRCQWNFSLTQSFRPHYGPAIDSVSKRNEYQEYFLEGKCGRCVGLTNLPPSYADCLEI